MFYNRLQQEWTFIEIGASDAVIAQFSCQAGRRPLLNGFAAEAGLNIAAPQEYLPRLFANNGFSRHQVSLFFHSAAVYVKLHEAPLSSAKELRQALLWDDDFWFPYRQAEVYADFIQLDGSSGRSRLLAVMVQRSLLDALTATLEAEGIFIREAGYSVLEGLKLFGDSSYTYLERQGGAAAVFAVNEGSLIDFSRYEAAEDGNRAGNLSDRLAEASRVIVSGAPKQPAWTELNEAAAGFIDFADGLEPEYVMRRLSPYLCGAAVGRCRC